MRLARGCTTMHARHGNDRQPDAERAWRPRNYLALDKLGPKDHVLGPRCGPESGMFRRLSTPTLGPALEPIRTFGPHFINDKSVIMPRLHIHRIDTKIRRNISRDRIAGFGLFRR